MSVTIKLRCCGCPRTSSYMVTPPLTRAATTIHEVVAARGWMPFDPYTGVTYCRACWESVQTDPVGD